MSPAHDPLPPQKKPDVGFMKSDQKPSFHGTFCQSVDNWQIRGLFHMLTSIFGACVIVFYEITIETAVRIVC